MGDHAFPMEWRNAVDNLFDLSLPENPNAPANESAPELISRLFRESDQKIHIVALGPLTNIAEAFEDNSTLNNNLKMLTIMGGSVKVPGNVGPTLNIENQYAEWNIYADPHAAKVVFEVVTPITLAPLDATRYAPATMDFYNRVKVDRSTPAAEFVYRILTKIENNIRQGWYYFWDPLAAAIATDESLAKFQDIQLVVIEEEGPDSGRTIESKDGQMIRVATWADGIRFEKLFLDTLNGRLPCKRQGKRSDFMNIITRHVQGEEMLETRFALNSYSLHPPPPYQNKEEWMTIVCRLDPALSGRWFWPASIAQLLLSNQADPNAKAKDGRTPLHMAVGWGQRQLVELLLANKADPNARDQAGQTPLDVAKAQPVGTPATRPSFSSRVTPMPGMPMPQPSQTESMAELLRRHGAADNLPRLDRITVRLSAKDFSMPLFAKGAQDWNQFTLLELIAVQYESLTASLSVGGGASYGASELFGRSRLPFPPGARAHQPADR